MRPLLQRCQMRESELSCISGEHAVEICDKIFYGKIKLSEAESHTVHYGHIIDQDEVIDEVMVLVLRAPKTYTREDTVEIDCHGGLLVMKKILACVCRAGARPAEPGEFTKRAFLNGRIDLAQAESVMDLISSRNEFALSNSLKQLNGAVSSAIRTLREEILYEIGFIESALDDPEHIDLENYPEHLMKKLDLWIKDLQHLLKNSDHGIILKGGNKNRHCRKAECREIFSFKCACEKRESDCNRYCGDDPRYSGRTDYAGWNLFKYCRYCRYSPNRRRSGKNRCKKSI